jgi:hypothetical protein
MIRWRILASLWLAAFLLEREIITSVRIAMWANIDKESILAKWRVVARHDSKFPAWLP